MYKYIYILLLNIKYKDGGAIFFNPKLFPVILLAMSSRCSRMNESYKKKNRQIFARSMLER